jgi:hypothetical protein
MDADMQLVAIIGGVHVIGLAFAFGMIWHFVSTEPKDAWRPPDEDGGGGGGGNVIPEPPAPVRPRGGGLPLPDAVPARVRLREPGRLADRIGRPERRPAREPSPGPRRTPAP